NGGRNILRADGLVQFDFTVSKRFRFAESRAAEFRAEFFNLFNHPTLLAPSTSIAVSSGAQVGSTLNAARTVELAIKVFFRLVKLARACAQINPGQRESLAGDPGLGFWPNVSRLAFGSTICKYACVWYEDTIG